MKSLNDLINEVHSSVNADNQNRITAPPGTKQPDITEETLNEWVIRNAAFLVQQGIDVSESVKMDADQSPENIDSYSNLLKAVAHAMDVLNKINIQNKKNKTAKELKELNGGSNRDQLPGVTNNTFIVATREEMMERLLKQANEKSIKTIDVEDETD